MRMILMESVLLSLAGFMLGTAGAIALTYFLSRLPIVTRHDRRHDFTRVILMDSSSPCWSGSSGPPIRPTAALG